MVSGESLAQYRFAVAEIDVEKRPVEIYTVIEGEDWEKAAQLVKDGHTQRIATAGYTRLVTNKVVGAPSFEAGLALVEMGS